MIPGALLDAYRRTRVVIPHAAKGSPHGHIVPAIVEDTPATDWPAIWGDVWVVTAWNPRSRLLSREVNRARQEVLRTCVRSAGLHALDALGRALGGDWEEESLALLDTSRGAAMALARAFDQHAVFRVRDGWLTVHATAATAPRPPGPANG